MLASPLPVGGDMPLSSSPPRFFLAGEADLAGLAELDPDRQIEEFGRGERIWILQTFLRLRRAGAEVELVDRVPASGLLVFHSKQERAVRRGWPAGGRAVLVGVRADNRQALSAEFEIVQNGRFADRRTRLLVPHWPQPGLVARDPARGTRIGRVAYKGFSANLHPDFAGERWRRFLAERSIEWAVDATAWEERERAVLTRRWADYTAIDLLLAVRPRVRKTDFSKPASKLVNAWLAGVPALLGPEFAFREIRRDALDYLEVANVEAAERAVDRLRREPELYRAMVEHGRRRARELDAAAITERWRTLLVEELPRLAADPARVRSRGWPLALRRAARLAARWLARRPAR